MRLFPIAAALTLAACGTAQSTQYFVLPDSQYIRPAAQGNEIAVKVNLAEPLANGGLVYQTDAYHVNLAKKPPLGSTARWRVGGQPQQQAQPPQSAPYFRPCFTQPKQPNPESLYRSLPRQLSGANHHQRLCTMAGRTQQTV